MGKWYKNAIFYELSVRAFADGNGDGHGDFIGLMQKADYLADLGVDCVWLLPFYPSPLRDDGYDVSDYYNISPAYGTLDDFKKAIQALHKRNIKVIVDLVLNHTSDQHPWFIESRASLDNPKRDWYVWSDTNEKYQDARIIFVDTEQSNWEFDPVTEQYYWHRFYKTQPDLNYDNPEVREAMIDVAKFWLNFGIDGFRADAVPYLFEREGTNCENLPETHEYLKYFRKRILEDFPDALLLAEANQWPDDLVPYLGEKFDMAFHFPIMPRMFMALRKGDCSDIIQILEDTPDIPKETQWCLFLRNHDELTLEMVTEEQRNYMWQEYAPDPLMKLNLGIRRRLAPLLDNDVSKIVLMHGMLLSLPGSPILYYGDEIGMGDNILLFDRNGVRTPMQWDDSLNGGFSSSESTYAPIIDDPVYGFSVVNVAYQMANKQSLWHEVRHLLHVRRETEVFGAGEFRVIPIDNKAIFAYERWLEEEDQKPEHVLVMANVSDQPQRVVLPEPFRSRRLHDMVASQDFAPQEHRVDLAPHQFMWLQLL